VIVICAPSLLFQHGGDDGGSGSIRIDEEERAPAAKWPGAVAGSEEARMAVYIVSPVDIELAAVLNQMKISFPAGGTAPHRPSSSSKFERLPG